MVKHSIDNRESGGSNPSISTKILGSNSVVERLAVNQDVAGSNPAYPAKWGVRIVAIAEDCKSPLFGVRWFDSNTPHHKSIKHVFSVDLHLKKSTPDCQETVVKYHA